MIDRIDEKGQKPANADNAAALAALRRAAVIARRRALAVSGYVLIGKGGKIVRESDPAKIFPDGMDDEPTS